MKLKITTETQTLLDEDFPKDLSEEDENKIIQFGEREIISYTIEFANTVKLNQTYSFEKIMQAPELVKQMIVKIK